MKTISITLSGILLAAILITCKSQEQSPAEKATLATYEHKINTIDFRFVASSVTPTNGMSTRHLDGSYFLTVNKDSIVAHLPYFGRAYTAQYGSSEGGIKFISKDFEYTMLPIKKGIWNVNIETTDTSPRYKLILKIGETGYTTLSVRDDNRQPISFYGRIE